MHATLRQLFEDMKSGLLWLGRDGTVRYANADASLRTGLSAGRRVYDAELQRAVAEALSAQVPRTVRMQGMPSAITAAVPDLQGRVIPGLSADDAFLLLEPARGADHGAAYDNLMHFIRADLREPLDGLKQALGVARDHGGADDSNIRHLLLDHLDDMTASLDKLLDLASVWGNAAPLADDRIEIWPLLQQVWAELQPLARSRALKVRFQAHAATDKLATLYGSASWLRRVFAECLETVLRAATPGSTLEIEHRQMGTRAMITFCDNGLPARRAGEASVLREPASAQEEAAACTRRARDRISLQLCQHVVALHGGQLTEEHEEEGSRTLLINLPTGAPHRGEAPSLDIEQAQQYARDLAALMARARSSAKVA